MAINIPSSVFNTYNEAVLLFTRTATLVYPEKKEDCPNCIIDNMAGRSRSVSRYQAGGPYPFERGMPCPYCGSKGYKAIESTDDITLRIYWDRKFWVSTDFKIDVPDGGIQTISYMTDLPKILRAKELIVHKDIEDYGEIRFKRTGEYYPMGLKQNRYVACFWERA